MGKIQGWIEKTNRFFKEVKVEMQKVTWPSKDDMISNTIVVIIATVFVSLLIGIEDRGLAYVLEFFFRSKN
ncbi:MAG: preprotein translocase subunit SecE [bacterium]